MTPEAYLQAKGYTPKKAPGEWLVRCIACGDSKNLRHAHLYINQEHGAWKCHRCGAAGSFAEFQKLHGDEPEAAEKETEARWRVFLHALEVCQDTLLAYPRVVRYLKEDRHLNAETIGKFRLGYMDEDFIGLMRKRGFSIADLRGAGLIAEKSNRPMFEGRVIIPYLNRDSIVTLRGKKIGGNTLQVAGITLGMYAVDNVRAHDGDVYLCEGEVDTMYLNQLGFPAAGVPGADTFQPQWASWLENARRVFICYDADEAGQKGALKVKEILGAKARIVDLPVPEHEESTDISEYFHRDGYSKADFENLISQHRGSRLFTIAEALEDRESLKGLEGISLGWKDLDHWLHPGLLPGQVMVVLAKTGVGKTAWLTQVLHNLSEYYVFDHGHKAVGPGLPVLALSLEQTKAELVERMWRIARFYDPWMDDELFLRAYRNVRVNDENKIPPSDMRLLYNEFIEEVEQPPRVLIVDYLGYWARSFTGKSRYEQVSEAIMELKALAKEFGVAVVIPHQVSRTGKRGERLELDFARDSGVVEETADFAMSLWAPHTKEERDDKEIGILERADVRLEILKSRHGGVGRETRMLWAPASLSLPPAGDPWFKRLILKEYEWVDNGFLYEKVHELHKGTTTA